MVVSWSRLTSAGEPSARTAPLRPVATFSIVARDPQTGDLGVAVQSHWFSVGSVVPWAEAGVGAVATQSFVEPSYGPLGLDLMRAGKSADEALRALLAADKDEAVRQVAMVDAKGRVATHTGKKCIAAAGHQAGAAFSCQANLMEKPTVWPAMAKAFESSTGTLARRMLAALHAAEAEGGDIRGRQSAAILVVRGKSTGRPWADRVVDLRIEDNPDPLAEMDRLLRLREAYDHMDLGDESVTAGDFDGAMKHYGAAQSLQPESAEIAFWFAVALATKGKVDDSLPLFAKAFAREPRLRDLVPRLPASGLLPNDDALVKRIVAIH
ncbi:MAG: DUF1028 domain-containing protein [Planctomycetes bacterium]|nr:DUF1028 domain-containing protein [Planctomycetota bacterium]